MNPRTGEVKLAADQSLDREKQSSYVLVITADDRFAEFSYMSLRHCQ